MIMRSFSNAWIGLGGNIGDVEGAMAYALQRLDAHTDCRVLAVSSLYKTPPWGKTDQPWFLNACARISTRLEPEAFLQLCLDIETERKRTRVEKWGPRTLDIDLLFYDDVKMTNPGRLILPHPRIAERAFVLMPLAEIGPDLVVDGQSVSDRAKAFHDTSVVKLAIENLWWQAK